MTINTEIIAQDANVSWDDYCDDIELVEVRYHCYGRVGTGSWETLVKTHKEISKLEAEQILQYQNEFNRRKDLINWDDFNGHI
jgi:hypothetical protein